MGLKHLDRPLWGLQFHPESVASEYGRELMGRFRDITVARNNGKRAPLPPTTISLAPTTTTPAKSSAQPAHKPACVHYDLHVRTLDFAADTEAVFDALFAGSSSAFWLDSAHVEPGLARFSHLGNGAGPLGETVRYQVGSEQVTVTPADGELRAGRPAPSSTTWTRELARGDGARPPDLPFDHTVRLRRLSRLRTEGRLRRHQHASFAHPDAQWIFADRTVTVDHELGRTYLLALRERTSDGSGEDNSENSAEEWLRTAADTLVALPAWEPPVRLAITSDITLVEPWLTRDRAQYLADVKACQRKLLDGESYEICLTNSVRIPAERHRAGLLPQAAPVQSRALRRIPALRRDRGRLLVAGTVPARRPQRLVESKPIKGTVRRGETPAEDRRLAEELDHQRQDLRREPDDRRPAAQRSRPGVRDRQRARAQPDGRRDLRHGAPVRVHRARHAAARRQHDRLRARLLPRRLHDRRAEAAQHGDHRHPGDDRARRLLRHARLPRL